MNWRKYKILLKKLLKLRQSPHELALGFAIGIFVGFLPIMGIQTPVAVSIAIFFRASKIASAIAVWISNPITFIPFYYFNFEFGKWLLGLSNISFKIDSSFNFTRLMYLGWDILYALWTGCVVLGLIATIPTYFIVYYLTLYYKNHGKKKASSNKK